MEPKGKIVVVTGASSGIGEVTAVAFARAGASLVLAARRVERLDRIVAAIERRGGTATAVPCDVGDAGQLRRLAAVVDEAFGRCDVLVNNAGISGGGAFEGVSFEQIERTIDVNVLGVMFGTKAFLPMMLRAGRGHIVNVASLAGRYAAPGASVYSASKHAVVAFSEALHHELEPRGVLVTSVNPGLVATEGFPQTGVDARLVMRPERVAKAIVDVVRSGKAPEVSVPRWGGAGQIGRVLFPGPYRWVVRRATGWARPER